MGTSALRPLFDFESIVDFNLAVIHMVREEFWTDKYFNSDIAINNEYFLKCAIISNKQFNPLNIILKPEYEDSADNIYREFLEEEILEDYYEFFPVGGLVKIYAANSFTHPTILCHNKKQAEYCKKIYDEHLDVKTIIRKPDEKIDINVKYDCYFTNNIWDIHNKLDHPRAMQFRVMRAQYNLEQGSGFELPLFEAAMPYMGSCKFGLVDPYTDVILPLKEEV